MRVLRVVALVAPAALTLVAGSPAAPAEQSPEAVMCASVNRKREPVKVVEWFPAGTKRITAWFPSASVPRQTRGEVEWFLNGAKLTSHDVTVNRRRPVWDSYSLPANEPLPNGLYEAALRLDRSTIARCSARVGGKPPARQGTTEHGERAPTSAPREGRVPAIASTRTSRPAADAGRSVPKLGSGSSLQIKPSVPADEGDGHRAGPAGAGPASPGAPTTDVAAHTAGTQPETASTADRPRRQPGRDIAGGTHVTTPATAPPTPIDTGVPYADQWRWHSTPLGPQTASSGKARPLAADSEARPSGRPQHPLPRPQAAARRAVLESRAIPRPETLTASKGEGSKPGQSAAVASSRPRVKIPTAPDLTAPEPEPSKRVIRQSSAASTATGPRQGTQAAVREAAQPPRDGQAAQPAVEPSGTGAVAAVPSPAGNQEQPGPTPEPAKVPSDIKPPAVANLDGEQEPPAAPEDEQPVQERDDTPQAVAEAGQQPPPEDTGTADTSAGAGTTEPEPQPQRQRVELGPPITADMIAEDLPPVERPDNAVQLHYVKLERISQPAGIQPLWAPHTPDGRVWPPDMPVRLGLYAGEKPAPSPANVWLYSDHLDGIIPLYAISESEVRFHSTREQSAVSLHLRREMYDTRRDDWCKQPLQWHWMWYVREVDLQRGDVIAAALCDLKRSRRVPKGLDADTTEYTILLDEAGERVKPAEMDQQVLTQIAESLDLEAAEDIGAITDQLQQSGYTGLSAWVAPAGGRYQVWAAIGTDKCRATCKTWTPAR